MGDTHLVMFILVKDQICRINAGRPREQSSFNFIQHTLYVFWTQSVDYVFSQSVLTECILHVVHECHVTAAALGV